MLTHPGLDLVNIYELAPAFALCLVAGLLVHSHVLNAAKILDRRRAIAREAATAKAARRSSQAKAAAFLERYAERERAS